MEISLETQKTESNPKPKIYLATLWHYYQPPGQTDDWVELISHQTYIPFSRWLANAKNDFRAAVNINYSLIKHLIRLRLSEVIENLGRAAEKGRIELTGSAAYHPILPDLLKYKGGKDEVKRQIELNDKFNREIFGGVWNPTGFFPPEMAFSPELATVIKDMGYKWSITDAPLFDATNKGAVIPYKEIGTVNGLPVFFRSDWSNEFSLKRPNSGDYDVSKFVEDMRQAVNDWFRDQRGHFVIAYDGETWGHHVKQYDINALDIYTKRCNELCISHILFSDLIKSYSTVEVKIMPGSWSSNMDDIKVGEYFPLWRHSKNPVHELFDILTAYAIEAVHAAEKTVDGNYGARRAYEEARQELDDGEHSCKEWWANPIHGRESPKHIYAGFNQLAGAINHAVDTLSLSGASNQYLHVDGFYGAPSQLKGLVKNLEARLRELVPSHHHP